MVSIRSLFKYGVAAAAIGCSSLWAQGLSIPPVNEVKAVSSREFFSYGVTPLDDRVQDLRLEEPMEHLFQGIKSTWGQFDFVRPWVKEQENKLATGVYMMALAGCRDGKGERMFKFEEYHELAKNSVPIPYILDLIKVQDNQGKHLFNTKDIIRFSKNDVDLEYIKELASIKNKDGNPSFNGYAIYRYNDLDLSKKDLESFVDTAKPNAIVMYPMSDHNNAFDNTESIELFRTIQKEYDVWVRVVSKDQEVYQALSYVPNPGLLMISGHGSKTSIALGAQDPSKAGSSHGASSRQDKEEFSIDRSDTQLRGYLSRMHPSGAIFLHSCSVGQGRRNAKNMVNFLARMAPGRTVIGATEPVCARYITIESAYPFRASMTDKDGKDITYRTNRPR